MYIDTIPNRTSRPCILLRESHREGKRVVKTTVANITDWPPSVIEAIRLTLRNEGPLQSGELEDAFQVVASRAHGHVAAIVGTIGRTGLDGMISARRCREKDLVIAMIASRIISPSSKLATSRVLSSETASNTINDQLALGTVTEDDLYGALDWLGERQLAIQKRLVAKHLGGDTLVFYDVSSSYFEGRNCKLAQRGYSRDSRPDKPQIVYGLLCNKAGCPVVIEVFEGNVSDPSTFSAQVKQLKEAYDIQQITWVGDRGMITSARIREDLHCNHGVDWVTCLRSTDISALINERVQPSFFDVTDMGEIEHPDYPNERLIVCRNPLLKEERARKREELLQSTERLLAAISKATQRTKYPLRGKDRIALRVGKVIGKYKMEKHFVLDISEDAFLFSRNQANIVAEQALDGIYIIRTSVSKERMTPKEAVETYKNLAKVERAFRCLKSVDLAIRPIHHRVEKRVRAHVFLCMLTYYIEWHMRQALAPLLFEDHNKHGDGTKRDSVVSPATRSNAARKKAARKFNDESLPVMSFSSLINNLSSIVQSTIQPSFTGAPSFKKTTLPTELQLKAFQLLNVTL